MIGANAFKTKQFIYRAGMQTRQKFAFRIGPLVLRGTGHVDRTWCD